MQAPSWVLTILGSLVGGFMLFSSFTEKGAHQHAVAAAIPAGFAVLPYCFARAVSELPSSRIQIIGRLLPLAGARICAVGKLMILVVIVVVSAPLAALAVSTSCLPFPLPTSPQSPIVTMNIDPLASEHGQAQIWRQACEDGSGDMAVLMRITPTTTPTVFVCSISFTISQGGANLDTLVTNTPNGASQCGDITTATTFLLTQRFDPKTFRERAPFTVSHSGSPSSFAQVPAPTITILTQGCTVCSPGQVIGFRAHVTNAGAARPAEIRAGVRFPDGSIVPLFEIDRPLGPGETFDLVLIPDFVLPPGVAPPGAYVIEAAILEPALGLLWSRASTRLQVQ
jgi:hypothetical protein